MGAETQRKRFPPSTEVERIPSAAEATSRPIRSPSASRVHSTTVRPSRRMPWRYHFSRRHSVDADVVSVGEAIESVLLNFRESQHFIVFGAPTEWGVFWHPPLLRRAHRPAIPEHRSLDQIYLANRRQFSVRARVSPRSACQVHRIGHHREKSRRKRHRR